jgi:hypothetical protein
MKHKNKAKKKKGKKTMKSSSTPTVK